MSTTQAHDVWRRARIERKSEFSARSRDAVVSATAHGCRLGHSYVGSEHLLLGVLDVERALRDELAAVFDVDALLHRVAAAPGTHVGTGGTVGQRAQPDTRQPDIELRPLALTPRARENLQRAVQFADEAGARLVRPSHIAMAVFEDHRGVVWQALRPTADANGAQNWVRERAAWSTLLALLGVD